MKTGSQQIAIERLRQITEEGRTPDSDKSNPPPMEKLTDESYMPFGKYSKGADRCQLKKVPASYLLWLWDNGIFAQPEKPIHAYIKSALKALQQEEPDYILKHKP